VLNGSDKAFLAGQIVEAVAKSELRGEVEVREIGFPPARE